MIENTNRKNNHVENDGPNYHTIHQTPRFVSIGNHGNQYPKSYLDSLTREEFRDLVRAESE